MSTVAKGHNNKRIDIIKKPTQSNEAKLGDLKPLQALVPRKTTNIYKLSGIALKET